MQKRYCKKFFAALTKKEKIYFSVFAFGFLLSAVLLGTNLYFQNTVVVPDAGGVFTEAVVGQPKIINPLYLSTQDVDRDVVEIIFSGLMKYDNNGQLVNDLIDSYITKEDGKTIELTLKNNLRWHDNQPLTADDVIFTIHLVQNPEYQSSLRIKWAGISVEKIDDKKIVINLPKRYSSFAETLTIKILPKHIFENIPAQNLPLSLLSKEYLIGSGPFKVKKIVQEQGGFVKKFILERNNNYHLQKPFLKEFVFLFFKDEKDLKKEIKLGKITGLNIAETNQLKNELRDFKIYALSVPRYFSVFFNNKQEGVCSDKRIRTALALATNKNDLIENVFMRQAQRVDSPILPDYFGFQAPQMNYPYNPQKAKTLVQEVLSEKNTPFHFTQTLTLGSKGKEVEMLQKCLAQAPAGGKDIYPEGVVNGVFDAKTKEAVIRFQEKYSEEILKPSGISKGTGDVKTKTREKLNALCFSNSDAQNSVALTLTTCDKFPLPQISEELKNQWEKVGFSLNIEKISLADLQNTILSKKNFELLLFGEALGAIPDPFPFWHSSQKDYPGLNIANYISKNADMFLEKARESQNQTEKQDYLEKFQETVLADIPAIFLVRPDYLYALSKKVQGFNTTKIIEPSKRFSTVEKWYIKTKRVFK